MQSAQKVVEAYAHKACIAQCGWFTAARGLAAGPVLTQGGQLLPISAFKGA